MHLAPVSRSSILSNDSVQDAVGEDREVVDAIAVDITFRNKNGDEIEPDGAISVSMSTSRSVSGESHQVLHIDDSGNASQVAGASADGASFEAGEFSIYVIVGQSINTVEYLSAADGKTYEVTVDLRGVTNIPEGAELVVEDVTQSEYDSYLNEAAKALKTNADAFTYAKLLDISIVYEGQEIQPNGKVGVEIQLKDGEDISNPQVVHFGQKTEVLDVAKTGNGVAFETSGFSIYAVVGEDGEGDNARMTLHFVVNGTEIAHMIVKNADSRDDLNTIIYDPGTGDTNNLIFKGWSLVEDYTVEDADTEWTTGAERGAMDIDDIRDWAEAKRIKEFEDAYVYAMLYDSYDISFFDEDNAIVHSDLLIFKAGDTNGVSYYINVPYEPKGQDFKFNGWYKDSDSTITPEMAPYPNQTTVTIKSDTMFSANPDEGHWLVFRENGDGASYTPPQFVLKNQKPTQPATDPTRNGYTFGGWYTDAACTSGNEFDFNAELTERTTVYAKWNVKNPADYTVIIWQQQVTGDQYDFVTSLHLSGTANTTVNSVSQRGTGNGAYARIGGTDYQYTGFHLKEFDQNVKIVPEGTSVVNVYYDRNEYTLTFQAPPEATASEGQRPWVYTYQTSDGVTLDQRQLYYHDGRWYQDRNGGGYWGYTYWNEWTGGVYSSNQYSQVKTITARYGADVSTNFPIVGTNGVTYNSGERWKPQTNSVGWSEVMLIVQTMPAGDVTFRLSAPVRPLKTMNYYVEALPTDTGTVTAPTLYDVDDNSVVSSGGKRFKLDFTLNARYNQVTIEDILTLDGFEILGVDKQKDNQNRWIRDTENNGTLNIYYTRIKKQIIYNDGVFVNGNGEAVSNAPAARTAMHKSAEILYGTSVADQENEYNPTLTGYVLEGWYLNKECAGDKFDFSTATMPKGGIQLYAKWVQVQYRVFLHANAKIDGVKDESLDWGGQKMSFRVDYNEQIAGGNPIKGTRDDYEIIGWYFDEALTQPFNFASYYLNDTTVTDTYDKTRSTELDKWSDTTESTNTDVNRFWIQRSLDLYAKWRAKLDGANGINVIYDATDAGYLNDGGTQVRYLEDSLIYKDSSAASAKGASTANAPTSEEDVAMQFLYWEVCKWTGEEELHGSEIDYSKFVGTGEHVYPGNDFTVLKANASMSEVEREDTEDPTKITHAKYTVLLRAVYGPKGAPTPTHITWYANNGTGETVTDKDLQINQAVDVKSATMFEREGYKFLGWARKVEVSNDEGVVQTIDGVSPTKLDKTYTEDDLFLKWDGTKFVATSSTEGVIAGNKVETIAADETSPYHGMVAVWETMKYTVSIQKTVVAGTAEDKATLFTIEYRYDDTSLEGGSVARKHDQEASVISEKVPYGTIVTVSETGYPAFEQSYKASRTTDDQRTKITPVDVAPETTDGGDFKITGDTVITVTNTRKVQDVIFVKNLEESQIAGDSSSVTAAEFTLSDGMNTYTANPASDGTVTFTGVLYGTYTLSETAVPTGYAAIAEHTVVVDENGYSIKLDGKDIAVEGVYTINDPKAETGSIRLVKTNEDGSKQLEGAVFEISIYDTERKTYLNPTNYEGIGSKNITGLKLGTRYQLKEIQAPDGYLLNGDAYYFQLKLNGTVQITDESGTVITNYSTMKISLNDKMISIKNDPGVELPKTGGPGTLPYTLGGFILMISALMYGFRMRRRERRLM